MSTARLQYASFAHSSSSQVEEDIRGRWATGGVAGWEDRGLGQVAGSASSIGLDLEAFDSVEDLESVGE